jgi:hypothetical protein
MLIFIYFLNKDNNNNKVCLNVHNFISFCILKKISTRFLLKLDLYFVYKPMVYDIFSNSVQNPKVMNILLGSMYPVVNFL